MLEEGKMVKMKRKQRMTCKVQRSKEMNTKRSEGGELRRNDGRNLRKQQNLPGTRTEK